MKKLTLASLVPTFGKLVFAVSLFAASGAVLAGDPVAGKAKSASCGGCHGFDGNSPIAIYPKLAGQNEAYIVSQLKAFKENKTRQNAIMMGMVAALSDQDMADIGAYFQAQTVKDAATHDDSKIAIGREIYKGGNMQSGLPACQACHGPNGAGTAGIGYPQLGGQYVDYTLAQLKAFKNGSRSNDDKALMRSVVEKMSLEEMTAVSHYIGSLK